ncbi:MAG: alcohol dehydrogenase catalytic domain-containing protein [Sphaerochaetaceae bacterium]|nr:alcohol dehydrogenase catalytic domain-containing protein [Sphaerochaetaceae bacterium]
MKVAKLTAIKTIEIVNEEIPQIKNPTEVQVKIKAVGICGTDLHIFKEGRADVGFPRVMGHELSGEITAIGESVTKFKVGDRVVLDPVFACGECATCKNGYPNVCENVKCYGVQMDGGYQEYIVEDEKHFYVFPDNISYEEAALAEPFSIGANIAERTRITDKDNVLIIGAGTIGLSVLQAAKVLGAKVMMSDIVDTKLKNALDMGADVVVNSKTNSLETVVSKFSKQGFNVVIDAVGVTPIFQKSIEFAAPRARIACIGFDSRPAEIPPVVITKKELSIIGSRMNCFQFPKVIKWFSEDKVNAKKMISKKYKIDDIQKAFEETCQNGNNIKTLIIF